ncbi:MAG: NADP oxidoreductase, partial [Burkholderiaceae bacterium]|nr:NADP oxidoreductase [Burkholderiaceae bacterium]
RVHPLHEVVHIDHFLPGCPPSAEVIWDFLHAVVQGHRPQADPALIRYD